MLSVVVWSVILWLLSIVGAWVAGMQSVSFSSAFFYGWGTIIERPPEDPTSNISGQVSTFKLSPIRCEFLSFSAYGDIYNHLATIIYSANFVLGASKLVLVFVFVPALIMSLTGRGCFNSLENTSSAPS